ncbi:hypothetical protein [Polynucleobacter yangtzensis]|jgi:hypothetical protein|uniref:Nucleoprotein n=1 Tax=Polynucleobacter yangtzensis TaxID=1743159 RepID=A0ABM8CPL6_9BURK|nr:hypothetical protein [Polynucleobacter yangtzensis]BDT79768.1 hypothetical protein PKF032_16560 [Polynucleobacter yangtzensis]
MNTLVNEVTVANNVVSNDTATINFDASKPLFNLEAKRIYWEQGAYRTSNQELYGILAECLGYASITLSTKQARARAEALEEFFKARGYKHSADMPLVTRVVKAVFGNVDRRRISTYSLVLRQAVKEGITALDLPTWIEDKGGVQEIKLGHSATYVSPKAKAQLGKQYFDGKVILGNAKSELLSHVADAEFMGTSCVLLAEQMADGSFDIKAVVRSISVVNAAYVALYGHQNKVMEAAKKEVVAANDADGNIAKQA